MNDHNSYTLTLLPKFASQQMHFKLKVILYWFSTTAFIAKINL